MPATKRINQVNDEKFPDGFLNEETVHCQNTNKQRKCVK